MRTIASAVFGGLQDNPSIAAGVCTFAVAFSLVAGNALYGQRGGHPVPLFATRDATVTQSVPRTEPRPAVARREALRRSEPQHIPIPEMRPRDLAGAPKQAEPATGSTLVREAQAALSAIGFYTGAIDGLYGRRTREAILKFEEALGLAPTGQVSVQLSQKIAGYKPRPAEASLPQSAAAPAPAPQPVETVAANLEDVQNAALVARIQIGLVNFGEVGISIDGVIGEQTREAIRNFQARYGLPVTGLPDETLLRKMEQIGALKKS